jgi:hypothetical protein
MLSQGSDCSTIGWGEVTSVTEQHTHTTLKQCDAMRKASDAVGWMLAAYINNNGHSNSPSAAVSFRFAVSNFAVFTTVQKEKSRGRLWQKIHGITAASNLLVLCCQLISNVLVRA